MGNSTNRWLVVGSLAASFAVAGAVFAHRGEPETQNVVAAGQVSAVTVGSLTVHVAGWVAEPGVVSVTDGSLVSDVIAAAGGLLPGADASAVNLAAPAQNGTQLIVPGPSEHAESLESDDGLVSINSATADELESLPGVGPVLAERIVAHRENHGRFETVEDLLDVAGIGEAKLAALREHVKP